MAFDATRSFPTAPRSASSGFGNWLKTGVLLAAMTALILVVGNLIGGATGVLIAGVFALLSNFVAFWFSDTLALKVHGARPLERSEAAWIHESVERLTQRAGMPMPRLYLVPSHTPNAFATGRSPEKAAVAVTTGLLQILDRREVEGVLAHELAHVQNRDTLIATIAATIAGAISGIAHMMQWAMIFGGGRSDDEEEGAGGLVGMLALIILAPISATVLQLAISRSREYGADATGAAICGDPHALADALEKLERGVQYVPDNGHPAHASLYIVNPLAGRSILQWFATHPPIAERVKRLRAMRSN
ncbi:zinc metalloprotease HtpX [Vulgatibacter sp.]|uniref:zinc metalloprotease HtpX n=1 Tax=Vulgatibacter sp. TaxID=1971226 RepID=UPI0035683793